MIIETLSTFPGMYDSVMGSSMMRIAQEKGYLDFTAYDLRDWTHDRHRTTDDDPYGGGNGLVMKCAPIFEAYQDITGQDLGVRATADSTSQQPKTGPSPKHENGPKPKTIFLTPCGVQFDDRLATELAAEERLLFICGHYEGIDQRVLDEIVDEDLSIGDYVLTGGEVAACVVIDCVSRMIEGVLPNSEAYEEESHMSGYLEAPQFTKPNIWHDRKVPEVMLSGNHAKIKEWKRIHGLYDTWKRRPDMLSKLDISSEDWKKILEIEKEQQEDQQGETK